MAYNPNPNNPNNTNPNTKSNLPYTPPPHHNRTPKSVFSSLHMDRGRRRRLYTPHQSLHMQTHRNPYTSTGYTQRLPDTTPGELRRAYHRMHANEYTPGLQPKRLDFFDADESVPVSHNQGTDFENPYAQSRITPYSMRVFESSASHAQSVLHAQMQAQSLSQASAQAQGQSHAQLVSQPQSVLPPQAQGQPHAQVVPQPQSVLPPQALGQVHSQSVSQQRSQGQVHAQTKPQPQAQGQLRHRSQADFETAAVARFQRRAGQHPQERVQPVQGQQDPAEQAQSVKGSDVEQVRSSRNGRSSSRT